MSFLTKFLRRSSFTRCLGKKKSGLLLDLDVERSALAEKAATGVLHLEITPHNNPHYASVGTGLLISRFGHFLTNGHCASDNFVFQCFGNSFRKCVEAVVKVKSVGDRELNLQAEVLYVDPSIDLALCKVKLPEDYSGHVFEFSYKEPKAGQGILTFGNPDNCKNATRAGIISGMPLYLCNLSLADLENCLPYHKNAPADFRYITCDMNAGCGFSGGPTVNSDGKVVGVNQGIANGDFGYYTMLIPVEFVRRFLLSYVKLGMKGIVKNEGVPVLEFQKPNKGVVEKHNKRFLKNEGLPVLKFKNHKKKKGVVKEEVFEE